MVRMSLGFLTTEFKKPRWCAVGAVTLALATAGFVVWQNSRVAVMWDLGYLLDTGWRIALGQMPYRDFPLVHAPMTFVIQALLMKVLGRHFFISWIYAAVVGGVGTWVGWRTLVKVLGGSGRLALVLAAPLVFVGVYCVYPHPIYDCDCGFWILIAVWLLGEMSESVGWVRGLVTGGAVVVPVFFKQNMGLPFAGLVGLGLVVVLMMNVWNPTLRKEREGWGTHFLDYAEVRVLIGIVATAVVAVVVIQATVGAGNYLHWTVKFAAARRLPGLSVMAEAYREPVLWWALPVMMSGWGLLALPIVQRWKRRVWVQVLAVMMMAAPFVFTLVMAFVNDDSDDRADGLLALWPLVMIVAAVGALIELRKGVSLKRVLPFCVLAAIHGSFLSQQLWGSTYAIWPLLLVLIAGWVAGLPNPLQSDGGRWVRLTVGAVIAVVLLVCGGFYAVSLERLEYVNRPDGDDVVRATLPVLRGMATSGPYVENFEEMVRFTELEIPAGDGLLLLPGEDLFYFATGRVPEFPVLLMDHATDPYSAEELMAEARKRNVRWVIAKRDLQIKENPMPEAEETMRLVGEEFGVYRELKGYEVYRRR
jgi:hypothetical protein